MADKIKPTYVLAPFDDHGVETVQVLDIKNIIDNYELIMQQILNYASLWQENSRSIDRIVVEAKNAKFNQEEWDKIKSFEKVMESKGIKVFLNHKRTAKLGYDDDTLFTIGEIERVNTKIADIVAEKPKTYSPLENLMWAYTKVTQLKYLGEDDGRSNDSRSIYGMFRSGKAVCVGYCEMLKALIAEIGDTNIELFDNSVNIFNKFGINKQQGAHATLICRIKDPAKGIDGLYYLDPTNDSVDEKGNTSITNFLIPIKDLNKTDSVKIDDIGQTVKDSAIDEWDKIGLLIPSRSVVSRLYDGGQDILAQTGLGSRVVDAMKARGATKYDTAFENVLRYYLKDIFDPNKVEIVLSKIFNELERNGAAFDQELTGDHLNIIMNQLNIHSGFGSDAVKDNGDLSVSADYVTFDKDFMNYIKSQPGILNAIQAKMGQKLKDCKVLEDANKRMRGQHEQKGTLDSLASYGTIDARIRKTSSTKLRTNRDVLDYELKRIKGVKFGIMDWQNIITEPMSKINEELRGAERDLAEAKNSSYIPTRSADVQKQIDDLNNQINEIWNGNYDRTKNPQVLVKAIEDQIDQLINGGINDRENKIKALEDKVNELRRKREIKKVVSSIVKEAISEMSTTISAEILLGALSTVNAGKQNRSPELSSDGKTQNVADVLANASTSSRNILDKTIDKSSDIFTSDAENAMSKLAEGERRRKEEERRRWEEEERRRQEEANRQYSNSQDEARGQEDSSTNVQRPAEAPKRNTLVSQPEPSRSYEEDGGVALMM